MTARTLSAAVALSLAAWACTDSATSDPCATANGGCDSHAICTDNNGIAACACDPGYVGDGKTCTNADACAGNAGLCSEFATCTNTPGSFACKCDPGYSGDGFTCTLADPCATGTLCDAHATCMDLDQSYTCTCNPGWSGDGKTCAPAGQQDAGSSDAGLPVDAGVDAGSIVDAGLPVDAGADAGPTVDAGSPDAGTDAGTSTDAGSVTLQSDTVHGQIQYDPLELQWRGLASTWSPPGPCVSGQAADGTAYDPSASASPSTPPCLDGLTVTMIDQIRQTQGGGPLGSGGTSDWQGHYSVPKVDLVNTDLGLLGSVNDPSGNVVPGASIVALPPFPGSGVPGTPIYVVSQAFMQHIANAIQWNNGTTMTYETMMSQGVALIHITDTDGVTPKAGQQLYWAHNVPEGVIQDSFYAAPNASLTLLPFSASMTMAPYAYYLSDNLGGAYLWSNGAVSTGMKGLVVVVGPPPLLQGNSNQYEMSYTASRDWGPMVVFGTQPNTVVDAFLPYQ